MKDWQFRIGTTVGVLMAIAVLWGQFGESFGLPSMSVLWGHSAGGEGMRQQEFRWDHVLRPGQIIEIKGINGSINAEPAAGNRIEVFALKQGRRNDPRRVRIEAVEHAGGVTLCAVYPSQTTRANSCQPGERNNMSVSNNDVQVRFNVSVPKGVRLVARTVNGSVKAVGLESDLVAVTVNGGIEITTSGLASASTVNGSITATLGGENLMDDLEFTTVNGSITVFIPEGIDASVGATTVGGRLASEFPLTLSRRRMQGVLGSGGPELSLKTVNGSIQLKRVR